MLTRLLEPYLSSKNAVVRKGVQGILRAPKYLRSFSVQTMELAQRPPVLINSIPKSGTHLLMQIVSGLPERVNFGTFISSMTSSFWFRERTDQSVHRAIEGLLPGEIARGHLFYKPSYADKLACRNVVNYFIYRDPRDVALSGAHYARSMNRWHRLHPYFRDVESIEEAITIAIRGLQPPVAGIDFPDIAQRYARYGGWLNVDHCLAIRYEDLQSEKRPEVIRKMAEFYAVRSSPPPDIDNCIEAMLRQIEPSKSHTFRRGQKAGWREAFTEKHCRLFHEIAGELLIKLGYEQDDSWVHVSAPTS